MLVLAAIGGAGAVHKATALAQDGHDGKLYGGTMALNQAYKFAEGPDGAVWIGPDSAKANVTAASGNVYMASDTEVDYYGDGGSWVKRAVGSNQEPVPAVHALGLHTESRDADVVVRIENGEAIADGDDGEIASGSNITSVIESAMGALTSGRDWKERVVVKGSGTLGSAITSVPDHTILDASAAKLTQADGANAGLLKPTGASHIEVIGGVWDGNKANQSSSDQLFEFSNCEDVSIERTVVKNAYRDAYIVTGGSTDVHFHRAVAAACRDDGFNPLDCDGVTFTQCVARDMTGNYGGSAGDGFHLSTNSENITVSDCLSTGNAKDGYNIRTDGATLKNIVSKNNLRPLNVHDQSDTVSVDGLLSEGDTRGIRWANGGSGEVANSTLENVNIEGIDSGWGLYVEAAATGTVLDNISIEVASGETLDNSGIRIDADRVTARNLSVTGSASPDGIRIDSGATDVDVRETDPSDIDNGVNLNDGVRPRWDGVIHGGPFGGVNISGVTGADEGDRARTTGASAAPADVIAVFDGSDWIYPSRGGAVTPS